MWGFADVPIVEVSPHPALPRTDSADNSFAFASDGDTDPLDAEPDDPSIHPSNNARDVHQPLSADPALGVAWSAGEHHSDSGNDRV